MIFLLDSSHDIDAAAKELGMKCGQLITPLSGHRNKGGLFAIDNGAFSGFDREKFLRKLEREKPNRERCLFVACPDVVGSARRTMEVWRRWDARLVGWKKALVLQDGIENLEIPWDDLDAVFVGGSTAFKTSDAAMACAAAAKILGKWVHVGRVNTPHRIDRWTGVADSVDGMGASLYSHMRKSIRDGLPLLDSGVESVE